MTWPFGPESRTAYANGLRERQIGPNEPIAGSAIRPPILPPPALCLFAIRLSTREGEVIRDARNSSHRGNASSDNEQSSDHFAEHGRDLSIVFGLGNTPISERRRIQRT